MRSIRTAALVLRQQVQAEQDQLYLLYTAAQGKVLARAFGVAKVNRLTAGHLLAFVPVDLLLQERQQRWTIIDARALQYHQQMSVANIARMQVIVQLIDFLIEPNVADVTLWQALNNCTQRLFGQTYPLTFLTCLVEVLQVLGLMPSITHCVITGQAIDWAKDDYWWSSLAGGLVCEAALPQAPGAIKLQTKETIKLLKILVEQPNLGERLRVPWTNISEAEQLLLSYIELLVQKTVKALPFIYTA